MPTAIAWRSSHEGAAHRTVRYAAPMRESCYDASTLIWILLLATSSPYWKSTAMSVALANTT